MSNQKKKEKENDTHMEANQGPRYSKLVKMMFTNNSTARISSFWNAWRKDCSQVSDCELVKKQTNKHLIFDVQVVKKIFKNQVLRL